MRRKSAALTTSQIHEEDITVQEQKAKPINQEAIVHEQDAPIGRDDNQE